MSSGWMRKQCTVLWYLPVLVHSQDVSCGFSLPLQTISMLVFSARLQVFICWALNISLCVCGMHTSLSVVWWVEPSYEPYLYSYWYRIGFSSWFGSNISCWRLLAAHVVLRSVSDAGTEMIVDQWPPSYVFVTVPVQFLLLSISKVYCL